MKTPVLFLVFNRPDTSARVFAAIRTARPERLYVAADGPRAGRGGEAELCAETRRIATAVDWPCEVKTLFRDANLGCGRAVSDAISWFFDNEPEGVILEDDCLPNQDFFGYCAELLERYRHEEKIMHIGGTNYQEGVKRGQGSYYYSAYSHVWGWASWRRAWQRYGFNVRNMPADKFEGVLKEYFSAKSERSYWRWIYNKMVQEQIDTWDYQWQFSIWLVKGVSVIPNSNLVSNIGNVGTHVDIGENKSLNIPTENVLPLTHPATVEIDQEADLWFYLQYVKPGRKNIFQRIISRVVRALN